MILKAFIGFILLITHLTGANDPSEFKIDFKTSPDCVIRTPLQKNPYPQGSAMHSVWGFGHRQTDQGYTDPESVKSLLIADLQNGNYNKSKFANRSATPAEAKDIILALARTVLSLSDTEEIDNFVMSLMDASQNVKIDLPHRQHFKALHLYSFALMFHLLFQNSDQIPSIEKMNDSHKDTYQQIIELGLLEKVKKILPEGYWQSTLKISYDLKGLKKERHGNEELANTFYKTRDIYRLGFYPMKDNKMIALDLVQTAEPILPNRPSRTFPKHTDPLMIQFINATHQKIIVDKYQKNPSFFANDYAVVNFANAHMICGGAFQGAKAQEESLARQIAGLYDSLRATGHYIQGSREAFTYPIIDKENLSLAQTQWSANNLGTVDAYYTPKAFLIFDLSDFNDKFLLRDIPIPVNVISSAAIDLRKDNSQFTGKEGPAGLPSNQEKFAAWFNGTSYDSKDEPRYGMYSIEFIERTKRRIRAQFDGALSHGHTKLITGLFGIGAFFNPANLVAECYAEVLAEETYKGAFKEIIFSIYPSEKANKTKNFFNAFSNKAKNVNLTYEFNIE